MELRKGYNNYGNLSELCDCNGGMFLISYTTVGVAGGVVVVLILRAATLRLFDACGHEGENAKCL